jgi:peptidyl-prolyl cis-trans isomerase C
MNLKTTLVSTALVLALPLFAQAQNITTVNGKPVPKARLTALMQQASRAGQPVPAEMEARARDEVVIREIFAQEAERRGIPATPEYKAQIELLRQTVLIRELFADFQKKNPVSEAETKAEYEKFKAASTGTEYRVRHILVEKEEDAKRLISEIKGGASFEELAKKNSKDPGSAENGGDLDFAKPEAYVPEFSKAMVALKKGEMTQEPVKSQFGFHILRLDDVREAKFPEYEEVKPQITQRITQGRLQKFQETLKTSAKTDYKFSQ